ncbi:MAG TPA: type VI secretion system tube protein Hcp, partial [Gemmatales bacterium]|nr:type VI secretion system tube protein Hcp [Gemmatales bacterium]HMP58487.1 type VI secretion system tube protein Hcp [Gemmatales bacterium]
MSFDTYLKLTDIPGEATAANHVGEIEIYSFSWGASNPTTVGSGKTGLSAGKVSISSFNIMKKTEKSSPKLFSHCCNGQHIAEGLVTMRKATGESGGQKPFLTYKFTDMMVESIQWSGSSGGDDTPTESCSFAFAKCEITYFSQDAKGAMAKAGEASWDLTKVTK